MAAIPVPQPPPSQSGNSSSAAAPVAALQELVVSLNRDRYKIQNLLSSLGFALRSFNNLHQFLEIVPLMAARVADTEASALVLFEPDGQILLEQLHCQVGQTCQDIRQAIASAARAIRPQPTALSIGAWGVPVGTEPGPARGKIARLTETVRLTFEREIVRELDDPQARLFGVPVLVKNIERGRLYVLSRDPEYVWTPMHEQLVQLVADQAAVAIANNDLTAELRRKERLDRELEIASDIQSHLLPQSCPQIAGIEIAADCQTANRVGGDYYDFIPGSCDRGTTTVTDADRAASEPWSIVIGDVMGKGVPAGLIMTMTRGLLRAEVLNRRSPAQILSHLNRVMYEDLERSHRFVTLFYSSYDPQSRTLTYSNAAHNPPLLWRAADRVVGRLDTNGMLIGLDTDSDYEDDLVQLASGDTVLYYTDGFTEALAPDGERFEEGRLIATFGEVCRQGARPDAILAKLFARLREFGGANNPSNDDMTLVVLQVC